MEFLDINYSETVPTDFDQNQISGIMVLVDKGLASKVQMDPLACSEELGEAFQKYITSVGNSKSNTQDKAIVSALISRYPKVTSDKGEAKEFKEHLSNLMKSKSIQDGGIKYLIERMMQADTQESAPQPQQPQAEQPQAEQPKVDKTAQQPQAQESNNSAEDEDFYTEWEETYDSDSELTEDDFSNLVGDNLDELYSLEEPEVVELKVNPARKFLKYRLMDKELSNSNEGFKRAVEFILTKDSQYHGGSLISMAPTKDHNDGYQIGDEVIKTNKDKAKSFMLDKRGNLVTKSMEKPNIIK